VNKRFLQHLQEIFAFSRLLKSCGDPGTGAPSFLGVGAAAFSPVAPISRASPTHLRFALILCTWKPPLAAVNMRAGIGA